jgi:hypothetical protein
MGGIAGMIPISLNIRYSGKLRENYHIWLQF